MDTRDRSAMANVVGWIALILSIIALVLAWTAFNNSSEENLEDMIQNQIQSTVQNEPADQPGGVNDDTTTPGANDNLNQEQAPAPTTPEDDAVRPDTN